MQDPLGKFLIELRDDPAFAAWHAGRVRGGELWPDDIKGSGGYLRMVLIQALPAFRLPRAPVQQPRYAVRVYGTTPQDAMTGYGLASDVIHWARGRTHGAVHIYASFDESGGTPGSDPKTFQPYVEFIIAAVATTQAVA